MGSIGKGFGKIAKKVAKPEILIPLALMAMSGGTAAPALAGKTAALTGAKGATAAAMASQTAAQQAAMTAAQTGLKSKILGTAAMQIPGTPLATMATQGFIGSGGKLALGKGLIGKGIMAGLKNPMSMKGAATYGGLGLLASQLTKDKVEGKDDKMNKQTQASYDMMRKMGEGMYSDEDLNTFSAPYLAQMGGDYDKVTGGSGGGPDEGGYYEKLYPGLNYNLTRYVRPGQGWLTQPQKDPWNPYMAEGGRVGLAGGGGPEWGSYKDWLESSDLLEKYPELEGMTPDEQQNFLEAIGLLRAKGGRIGMQLGGLGSIPQTPIVPQGQQLDGRGGGFIPMGAQEGKDDVPAMLANNEFVMTSDAVRAAGGGDINKGAQKMYDLMNSLEARA